MHILLSVAAFATCAAYLAASVCYLVRFYSRPSLSRWILWAALGLAVACHIGWQGLLWAQRGGYPMSSGWDALSTVALALGLVYLSIEVRIETTSTGIFILGLSTLFTVPQAVVALGTHGNPGPRPSVGDLPVPFSGPLGVHIFFAVLGVTAAAMAAVYGLLYLLLYRQLKSHSFGRFYRRLPPLEVLERITAWSALVTFLALSLAIPLGFLQLYENSQYRGTIRIWDGKIVASIAAWCVYGVVWASRRWLGWSSRRMAYGSMAGFGLVLASVLVVNVFLSEFHWFG